MTRSNIQYLHLYIPLIHQPIHSTANNSVSLLIGDLPIFWQNASTLQSTFDAKTLSFNAHEF